MSDAPDDLGIPMKPSRPTGQPATVAPLGRPGPAPVPPRTPDPPRPLGEARAADAARGPSPSRRDAEARKLIVGR